MATFTSFEEIKAWQKARILNQRVGEFIESGRFKSNFRLINQIEGSAGSIMDNIARVLREAVIGNFFNSYIFLKVRAESFVRNCIEL